VLGEEGGRLDQEAGRGLAGLISQDLAEGDPGAVVHGRVKVVIADAPAPRPVGPAVDPVAASLGDPAQLLDVDVDQLTGCSRW